ncbi:MAG: 50S ribosomal protein L10 [Candidatus Pacebacteria bacterium]|nr:50S ribosomal protein L10 [Candidatus Paceibacterota bacterium]MDD2757371.1 50S ribosomal protein L10 [Candidatus Paceibacterota bacterium]MDD3283828.1 50S ribosomal protein L10 [Candidatus Paceibacterota bacterium]MDD3970245.1 50S ribosomal protein L10 [Candidatus Paceibacterota bacterium]MDD4738211.1 50S ribosomal protein L10 [Candidatus Paceibacterota bacterium]
MALTKEQKQDIVSNLEQSIEKQKSIVFVGFDGVDVKEITQFRELLKDGGSEMKVAKKSLMKIALKNKDIEFEPQELEGEVAMVFGYEDEIAPSKLSYDFSKKNEKIKILGGFLENKFYEINDVIKLAQLPNKEQLLGMLVGTLNAPTTNLVGVLSGNTRKLVYALSQIRDKKA